MTFDPRLFSCRNAALLSGVPYHTVYAWKEKGLLRPSGDHGKYTRRDVVILIVMGAYRMPWAVRDMVRMIQYVRALPEPMESWTGFVMSPAGVTRLRAKLVRGGHAVDLAGPVARVKRGVESIKMSIAGRIPT
jgi:hypothetical protein